MVGMLVAVVVVTICLQTRPVVADASRDTGLRAVLEQFVDSVRARDDVGIDETMCLDLLVPAMMRRRAQLGLLTNSQDPALREQVQQTHRLAVYERFALLLQQSQHIGAIDTSRVHIHPAGRPDNETLAVSEHPGIASLQITGSGIVGITLPTHAHVVDMDVHRIDDRWCLLPPAAQ